MENKDCKKCEYYAGYEESELGECNYPVPAWIYQSNFVKGYEAKGCLTYKHNANEKKT